MPLQKHLGYFNHIFRLSHLVWLLFKNATKYVFLKVYWETNYLISVFSEDLFGYIPGISTKKHTTKELLHLKLCNIKKTTNLTRLNAALEAFWKKILLNKREKLVNYILCNVYVSHI